MTKPEPLGLCVSSSTSTSVWVTLPPFRNKSLRSCQLVEKESLKRIGLLVFMLLGLHRWFHYIADKDTLVFRCISWIFGYLGFEFPILSLIHVEYIHTCIMVKPHLLLAQIQAFPWTRFDWDFEWLAPHIQGVSTPPHYMIRVSHVLFRSIIIIMQLAHIL